MCRVSKSRLLLALCFAVCAASGGQAQIDTWGYWQNGVSEGWWFSPAQFTTQQADEAIARWKNIEDENHAGASNEWMGTYFCGSEVHGTYLRMSPRSGFVIAHVDKCQAKVVGLTYGSVEFSRSVVKLLPQFYSVISSHGSAHSHTKTPTEMRFVSVKLNDAQLLVKEKEMASFGNYIAGLGSYNFSDFHYSFSTEFLTSFGPEDTDHNDGMKDRPPMVVVPAEYAHYLKQPIEATIIRVGRVQMRKTYSYQNSDGTGTTHTAPVNLRTVVVNAGTAHGLKRGMFLNVVDPRQNERVRILSVSKTSSTGVIIRDLDENYQEIPFDHETGERYLKIVAGRKLTTSPF